MRRFWFGTPDGARQGEQFLDRDEALRFLRREASDAASHYEIRRWAGLRNMPGLTYDDILAFAAHCLCTRELQAFDMRTRLQGAGGGTPTEPKDPKDKPKPKPKPKKDDPVCPDSVKIEGDCHILMVGETKTFKAVERSLVPLARSA